MYVRIDRAILLSCCFLLGCGSARVVEEPGPKVYRALLHALRGAQVWTPNYISTGLSTGIMLSTGASNGSRITMDVWRYPIETTAVVIMEPVADPEGQRKPVEQPVQYLEIHTDLVILNSAVNDLGQAFFKIPPGTYLLHPRTARSPNVYVAQVEVREGTYAIVTVRPEAARASLLGRLDLKN